MEDWTSWVDLKYKTYLLIQDMRGGQKRVPQTTLVAIGDAEYYSSKLAGRKPLKRDYVASLVQTISAAKPRLIALDIDFRSPNPDSSQSDFADYSAEDETLFAAICDASLGTKIVLGKAVGLDVNNRLVADRNIYDLDLACKIPSTKISTGYLQLPVDLRRVPLSIKLADGSLADSLSLAAARALYPQQYPQSIDIGNIPYGEFHRQEEFARVTASEVLAGNAEAKLQDHVVIVYGDWHVLANHRGSPVVDTFHTPVGIAPGAYVHANLIETLLATELKYPPPEYVVRAVEILLAAFLAVAFAFPISLSGKISELIAVAATLLVLAWFFFQVFAVSFDALPVLAAMGLHAVADQILEWREAAHASGHATADARSECTNARPVPTNPI